MRFFSTAATINRELTKFQFDWDQIDIEHRYPSPKDDSRKEPAIRKIERAKDFCVLVLNTVDGEITVWSNEFRKRSDSAVKTPAPETRP
jgi:hypothetical protein